MKGYVEYLHQICDNHPIKEKILLVETYGIGTQIIAGYVDAGYDACHIKVRTVFDLATDLVETYSPTAKEILEQPIAIQLLFTMLKEMKRTNSLQYFTDIEITPAFTHSVHQMLQSLRMAAYTRDNFNSDCFISSKKAYDFYSILLQYEQLLIERNVVDTADILIEALTYAKPHGAIYIIQPNLMLSYLEEQLIERIMGDNSYVLPLAPVYGIPNPIQSKYQNSSDGVPTSLSYLYDLKNSQSCPDPTLFTAQTTELEVKNTFQLMKEKHWKWDECVLFYTNQDPYCNHIYQLAEKADLPVTFGDGIPILYSRPGKLIQGCIRWIKSNYSVAAFIEMLNDGVLAFGDSAPSKARMARLLVTARIGYGHSRYLTQLDRELSRVEEQVQEADEQGFIDHYEKKLEHLLWLHQWFEAVFHKLPSESNQINFKKLLTGISYLLKNFGRTGSALDEVAKTKVLDTIKLILPYTDETVSMYEAFDCIHDCLLTIQVQQSSPKPGHLHVMSYQQGIYNVRNNVFVVGLDNRKFPGHSSQDPLLLDEERARLGHGLRPLQEQGNVRLYSMLQLLAESSGSVTLSYCNFDMGGNRPLYPCHLFLQAYRMKENDDNLTFEQVKKQLDTIKPAHFIEKKDFWFEQLLQAQPSNVNEFLQRVWNNIQEGLVAQQQQRNEFHLTPFDGVVEIDPEEAAEVGVARYLSAGTLETLAKCPYGYFLQEILKVTPKEEIVYDATKWLDPASRGQLLHSIFETFYKELKQNKEKPSCIQHEEMMVNIANAIIEEYREEIPPPSDRVFRMEVEDIHHCCKIFLREEEEYCENYEPEHFEYSFGRKGDEPAVITLPSGKQIKVAGVVDRVDRRSDGRYHIIDYKTGSTYNYSDQKFFRGGRQLQHFIYALAIEHHLNLDPGSVVESSYYFPSVKGLGKRYVREQNDAVRTNGMDILERLLKLIQSGHFVMSDDDNDCKYCLYITVCRREFYHPDTIKGKHSDLTATGLQRFKGVRDHG
ncbi:hypothetical protein BHU72_07525 [Desulfuribacillus stibiiarsenatis]|uniref:PD-(D/E)XK endonuclease-like domain-containing protein n=1 Tax=Desulfuribacillus stibiiarsenatis TaxID=1390249 RepID=A0A1E5L3G3_9FIRM|nr:PD-(D/E)XK nuclease family protein [Desulfuribacillus stibiiarsenatis]OEH84680.1 hypothetical protein BHU72_07525 [Desulfuribacillus stibiiarsenatis]